MTFLTILALLECASVNSGLFPQQSEENTTNT